MVVIANILIGLGTIGILESTFGNAGLAWLLSRWKRQSTKASELARLPLDRPLKIELMVPAHNEEKLIQQTLTSLEYAKELFSIRNHSKTDFHHPVQIHVGIDHCTDKTEKTVRNWAIARGIKLDISHNYGSPCKWNTLQQLVKRSRADWVALVDAGSVWEEGLLTEILPHLVDPQIMCIAPSYRPAKAGRLENLIWRLERFLKSIESEAGGPVSVHGATVFYRRETLLQAFTELKPEFWLNDDVVIPLVMRTRWPELKIKYFSKGGGKAWVRDFGIRSTPSIEFGRRKRMLLGNVQWIRALYWKAWKSDASVGLIAARRVFRTFWAYWVLLLASGIALRTIAFFQPSFMTLGLGAAAFLAIGLIPTRGSVQRLRAAFLAGLEIPYHWFTATRTAEENIWI